MGEQPDASLDELDLDSLDTPSNENFVALRKYARKVEKLIKDERKAHGETQAALDTLKAENQTGSVKAAAKAKGLTDEQVDVILALSPNATAEQVEALAKVFPVKAAGIEEETDEEAEETPESGEPAAGAAGFVPSSGGTKVPSKPSTSDDIKAALARGDMAAIERIATDAAKDPSKLSLKHDALIG